MYSSLELTKSKALCNRGFWTTGEKPNSLPSFPLAASLNLGETIFTPTDDLRKNVANLSINLSDFFSFLSLGF